MKEVLKKIAPKVLWLIWASIGVYVATTSIGNVAVYLTGSLGLVIITYLIIVLKKVYYDDNQEATKTKKR